MKALFLLTIAIATFWSSILLAHPVSYKGSRGLMGYHSPILSHNQINYSFDYWFAAGLHHIRRPNLDARSGTFVTANFLMKRWNEEGLQANFYLNLGFGDSHLGENSQTSGIGSIQFDIEDRDYYFLAKHLQVVNSERTDLDQTIVRAGFTPYVDGFDGIHSWLIFEWQSSDFSDGEDLTDFTPFLRVFYKNLLFEIGQSFDGITKFNYITHF
jgi:hypothetical protein